MIYWDRVLTVSKETLLFDSFIVERNRNFVIHQDASNGYLTPSLISPKWDQLARAWNSGCSYQKAQGCFVLFIPAITFIGLLFSCSPVYDMLRRNLLSATVTGRCLSVWPNIFSSVVQIYSVQYNLIWVSNSIQENAFLQFK